MLSYQSALRKRFSLVLQTPMAEIRLWQGNQWRIPLDRVLTSPNSATVITNNRNLEFHGRVDAHYTIALATYEANYMHNGRIIGYVTITAQNKLCIEPTTVQIADGMVRESPDWRPHSSIIIGFPADLNWDAVLSDYTLIGHVDTDVWRWRAGQPIALPKEWVGSTKRWQFMIQRNNSNKSAVYRRSLELAQHLNSQNLSPTIDVNETESSVSVTLNTTNEVLASSIESVDINSAPTQTNCTAESKSTDDSDYELNGQQYDMQLLSMLELQYGSPPVGSSTIVDSIEINEHVPSIVESPIPSTSFQLADTNNKVLPMFKLPTFKLPVSNKTKSKAGVKPKMTLVSSNKLPVKPKYPDATESESEPIPSDTQTEGSDHSSDDQRTPMQLYRAKVYRKLKNLSALSRSFSD